MKTAALYLRVSTTKKSESGDTWLQNLDLQREPLLKLCQQRNWTVAKVYEDRMSGASEVRPGFRSLMTDAKRGLFGVVVVWRFDRFARSVKQLMTALDEFRALNIDFVSHQESVDTSTPMGKMIYTVIAAVAELERDILKERTQAGVDYAKAHGTKSGRPIGAPVKIWNRDQARALKAQGWTVRGIARELGIPETSVARALKASPKPHLEAKAEGQ